ncbi:ABC transporter permease subunit [Candidatus Shapirobacteria bacterium]|nr:ABC transporter permease subunit [Candidatus Shapirobacteria bacterium]
MKKVLTIAAKEFQGYFFNPIGYVFLGIMLMLACWVFWGDVFVAGNADIKPLFQTLTYLFSVFIPAITMGWIADEKKSGTWEVLITNPVNIKMILWGKMLAGMGFLLVSLLLTTPTLLSLLYLGKMDIGVVFSGYVGLFLLGSTYLAIGLWISSLTKHPAVAFIGTTIVLVLNSLMSQEMVLSKIPYFLARVFEQLSLNDKMTPFYNGEIGLNTTVYLVSTIVLFTWLAQRTNEKNN